MTPEEIMASVQQNIKQTVLNAPGPKSPMEGLGNFILGAAGTAVGLPLVGGAIAGLGGELAAGLSTALQTAGSNPLSVLSAGTRAAQTGQVGQSILDSGAITAEQYGTALLARQLQNIVDAKAPSTAQVNKLTTNSTLTMDQWKQYQLSGRKTLLDISKVKDPKNYVKFNVMDEKGKIFPGWVSIKQPKTVVSIYPLNGYMITKYSDGSESRGTKVPEAPSTKDYKSLINQYKGIKGPDAQNPGMMVPIYNPAQSEALAKATIDSSLYTYIDTPDKIWMLGPKGDFRFIPRNQLDAAKLQGNRLIPRGM